MSFAIFTDTSANLPAQLVKKLGVHVIPFHYVCGGRERCCLDTEAFDTEADDYYANLKAGGRVSTSQITPEEYREHFEPALKAGEDVLFVGMSSGISNSYNSSLVAANALLTDYPERRIFTVDTLAASLGEGLEVLRAVECRDSGMGIAETAQFIKAGLQKLYQVVLIEDLMHLHRGGRISAPKALLGTVLGVRPILKGDEEGRLVVSGKVRGRRNGLKWLADKYRELVDRARPQTVGIAYTDCKEDAFALRDMLAGIFAPKEFMIRRYEPVTGSYIGPGTVALFFEGGEDVRKN